MKNEENAQLNYGCQWVDFHETLVHSTTFCKEHYTEIHENPKWFSR